MRKALIGLLALLVLASCSAHGPAKLDPMKGDTLKTRQEAATQLVRAINTQTIWHGFLYEACGGTPENILEVIEAAKAGGATVSHTEEVLKWHFVNALTEEELKRLVPIAQELEASNFERVPKGSDPELIQKFDKAFAMAMLEVVPRMKELVEDVR